MDRYKTYGDFWPFYLAEHSNPWTVRLHVIGTVLSIGTAVALYCNDAGWLTLSAVIVGYAFAWYAHFFIEHNRPATFKYPLWSFVSDFRLAVLYLTGRLAKARLRSGPGHR